MGDRRRGTGGYALVSLGAAVALCALLIEGDQDSIVPPPSDSQRSASREERSSDDDPTFQSLDHDATERGSRSQGARTRRHEERQVAPTANGSRRSSGHDLHDQGVPAANDSAATSEQPGPIAHPVGTPVHGPHAVSLRLADLPFAQQAEILAYTRRDTEGLSQEEDANRGTRVDLQGRFQTVPVAVISSNGELQVTEF